MSEIFVVCLSGHVPHYFQWFWNKWIKLYNLTFSLVPRILLQFVLPSIQRLLCTFRVKSESRPSFGRWHFLFRPVLSFEIGIYCFWWLLFHHSPEFEFEVSSLHKTRSVFRTIREKRQWRMFYFAPKYSFRAGNWQPVLPKALLRSIWASKIWNSTCQLYVRCRFAHWSKPSHS